MTKDPKKDAVLKNRITANEATIKRYKAVRKEISSNSLDEQQDLSSINDYIKSCKDIVDKIDGNDGYGYLSTLKEKLNKDIKKMGEYRNFVRDSNKSLVNLYKQLGEKISALEDSVSADKDLFNEGHNRFTDEYFFW